MNESCSYNIQPRRTTTPHLVHKAPAGASAPGKDLTRHIVLSCLPAYNVNTGYGTNKPSSQKKVKAICEKALGRKIPLESDLAEAAFVSLYYAFSLSIFIRDEQLYI